MWVFPDSFDPKRIHDGCMAIQMTETMNASATAVRVTRKGWHDDPRGDHKLRYHDGDTWTEHTTHFGPVPCHGCR